MRLSPTDTTMVNSIDEPDGRTTDVSELHQEFLRMEAELGLFDQPIDGVQFWEYVRYLIHKRILIESGHWDRAHTAASLTPRTYAKGAAMTLRNVFQRNPFLSPSADILFFGHQRRKRQPDGYWWDIWSDPIIEALSMSSLLLEKPYQTETFTHLRPAKTPSVRYLDLVEGAAIVGNKLGVATPKLDRKEREGLTALQAEIEQRFGTSIDVKSIVADALADRRVKLPLFERILQRVDPDVAVVLVSYGQEAFIEACKRHDVASVELQHGAVTPSHFGYHYPGDRHKETFPDYFFTFGEFWSDVVDYPIPDNRVLNVGYPFLETQSKRYAETHEDESVLFISQGTVGERISKLAVELTETAPSLDVIYKLHPGEYARWRELYPWLEDADIRVVDSDDVPLYELLAAARAQVGVNSTVIFEGFNFDLETYLVDAPGIGDMEWLLDRSVATLVSSGIELGDALQSGTASNPPDSEQFFTPNATQNAVTALSSIVDGRSVDE